MEIFSRSTNKMNLIEELSQTKGLSVCSLISIAIPAQYCL